MQTKKTMEHTPTPWIVDHWTHPYGLIKIRDDKYQREVCADLTPANAAFIVAACNAHEDLVRAIQIALWAENNGEAEAQKQGKPRLSERINIFKQALAKVGVK